MEGLSIMLSNNSTDHSISGIKITKLLSVVHLMFVDDVLILSKADPREWKLIVDLLTLYCSASGLCINTQKTTVHYWGLKDEEMASFKDILPFTFTDLNNGFKYLGYYLKPGPSKSVDWSWLVAKFEKKISQWCNKWLSLGGRLILVKAVLESLAVFWMSLAVVPKSILNKIHSLTYAFLWSGHKEKFHIHLCRWDILARPKSCGGWGLKNLPLFNSTLIANTYWRALNHGSIWNKLLIGKYLGNSSISTWLRKPSHKHRKASSFWNGWLKNLFVILHWIHWLPGDGNSIVLGRDMISGMENQSILSDPLRAHLSSIQLISLAHARVTEDISVFPDRWRSSDSLGLVGQNEIEWNTFTSALRIMSASLFITRSTLWSGLVGIRLVK
jgi:hypothetical protein